MHIIGKEIKNCEWEFTTHEISDGDILELPSGTKLLNLALDKFDNDRYVEKVTYLLTMQPTNSKLIKVKFFDFEADRAPIKIDDGFIHFKSIMDTHLSKRKIIIANVFYKELENE